MSESGKFQNALFVLRNYANDLRKDAERWPKKGKIAISRLEVAADCELAATALEAMTVATTEHGTQPAAAPQAKEAETEGAQAVAWRYKRPNGSWDYATAQADDDGTVALDAKWEPLYAAPVAAPQAVAKQSARVDCGNCPAITSGCEAGKCLKAAASQAVAQQPDAPFWEAAPAGLNEPTYARCSRCKRSDPGIFGAPGESPSCHLCAPETVAKHRYRCAECKAPLREGYTCGRCGSDMAEDVKPQPLTLTDAQVDAETCAACNGVGKVGIPGAICPICSGQRKTKWTHHIDALNESITEIGLLRLKLDRADSATLSKARGAMYAVVQALEGKRAAITAAMEGME